MLQQLKIKKINKRSFEYYYIIECPVANAEHKLSKRQYAHVRHHKDNIICVAHAIWTLPDSHLFGVLAHEIGHLISGGGERAADNIMLKKHGIKIQYASTDYGDNLQYLNTVDAMKFFKLFSENIIC